MRRVAFVIPGDINTRTGGYIYDRRIVAGLRARGWRVEISQGDLDALPDQTTTVVDGLALLTLAGAVERHASRLRIVPLIHLPLGLEVGLDPSEAARRHDLEERVVRSAPLVVATGRVTIDELVRRGIPRQCVALVEPGTDRVPLARGSGGTAVALLTVAALTPGKRHELLLRALAAVPSRDWRLTCAGSCDRDPATAARVRALICDLGLTKRVTLTGELDDQRLAEAYDRSDLVALPTCRETYGMAIAEGIARGLPVVSTPVGAIPDIVGAGGILVEPEDEAALAMALTRVIGDAVFRRELAARARMSRERLPTWDDAARRMADVLSIVDVDG